MTDTTQNEIRAHLAARLMETANGLSRGDVLPEAEIATAFVMTGATIAACHNGAVGAAEWLRDLADAIEQGEKSLNGPMQ
ncbi:hypothetical protein M8756_00115 [Lutimaribacter sp. EGI FJ00015]|uniref:Uncharacterized protein n=1 Tax=Lutimaribacter degradans TaxID=2945989 RepID=A0ACC5ZUB4_9RHOB|nr:hypothetical protein [Lutimaribacter sp. EGI FJ00013]MCM2561351.1 hypothetical protein [Lutimaribacter sp. EGI FJ00013]MCO0611698.1 hypothetical protein [Lutimaribacter sp. EGI FJ00015]MCO0635180.1 hypothetical protein [Lutimaribacter sp. EGI FJ00014]